MSQSEEQRVTEAWLAQVATEEYIEAPSTEYKDNPLSTKRWEDYHFDLDVMADYGIKDISSAEAGKLGFTNASDGIYITYPRDEDSRIRWARSGFDLQVAAGKYGQRPGTQPALYYPPTLSGGWKSNTSMPVLITEGEFKAMAVDVLINGDTAVSVIPCAVGGVFSWQSTKQGIELIQDLADISWMGRTVYMAFDMDQNTNPMVVLGLQRLTNKLAGKGAEIRVMQWPSTEGKGLDDYLCEQLAPRETWLSLVATAQFPAHVTTVMDMNNRYTYCEVQQQVYDSQNTTYITTSSFCADFFTRQIKIQTGVKNGLAVFKDMPVGKYWMSSPFRATCIEPLFAPGQGRTVYHADKRYLNTWLGWGQGLRNRPLEPKKGDVRPFYDFLHATFGGESPEHVKYLVKRIAWMFQQPEKKHPTWLYFMGRPLQGKSTLIKIISTLIGERYTANVDESIVKGQFAEWRAEKLLVTFDDSSITDHRIIRQLLKRLTTESSSQVNLKYVKAQTTENYFSFIFATNSVDALLDHDDRRALVLEADCKWSFEKGEWKEFDVWRSTQHGMQALLHHLMYEVKIEAEFYNEVPPKTNARELVIEVSESTWDDTINYLAMETNTIQWQLPATGAIRKWKPTVFTIDMLRHIFMMRNGDVEKYRITSAALVGKLVRYGASRCAPEYSADRRKRMLIGDAQVTLWTWNREWVHKGKEDFINEYLKLEKAMPELFVAHNAKY